MEPEIIGFRSILDLLFIARALHNAGRGQLIEEYLDNAVSEDLFYEQIFYLTDEIFEDVRSYYDDNDDSIMVYFDHVITEFYTLAAEYGKKSGISDEENPYYKALDEEANDLLNISACVGWKLPASNRWNAKKSRIVIMSSPCSCDSFVGVLYGLVMLYDWLKKSGAELRKLLEVSAA